MSLIARLFALLLLTGCSIGTTGAPPSDEAIERYFAFLHRASESLYDGDGRWGERLSGYRMMLRDTYWRADVYGALCQSQRADRDIYCRRHREAIDSLLRAQKEAGTGVLGVPADPGNPEFGRRIRAVIDACPACIRNGWIADMPQRVHLPELYYDHGYALVSLVRAYRVDRDERLLPAIRAAADWAVDMPITRNVNYLSALAKGLSYAYSATHDRRYLDRALELHDKGIFPYQTELGDWDDPHNARLEYHGFIVSGLIALRAQLPHAHPSSQRLDVVLAQAVARMAERNLSEPAPADASWPGTNLLAWWELSLLRPLSETERQAMARTTQRMLANQAAIERANGFARRKALYMNFFAGLLLAKKPREATAPG